MDEGLTKLAGRILDLRREHGLSQERLAKRLRVSQSWLSQVERGERPPSKKLATRLERVFKLPKGTLTEGVMFMGPGRPRRLPALPENVSRD
ncbi:MAG: helix-turn-helix domain-containing protein [Candidatus Xenobia bacterium]